MKKRLIQLTLLIGLMALTCVAARAAEADSGFRNLQIPSAYANDFAPLVQNASGETVNAADDGTYPGAAKLRLTYKKPQSGSEYLLIVLSDDDPVPSVDNMAYIDQKPGTSIPELDFTIYPKKTDAASVTYSVYLYSDNDATAYEKVATFDYYSNALDVTLGDVNDDGAINVTDAILTLQHFVEAITLDEKQKIAADVSRDGVVNVTDAVLILQYFVEAITEFPQAGT